MKNKLNLKSTSKIFIGFVIIISAVEFLLPVNPYIPKLSTFIQSLDFFYNNYSLTENILISISTVYASMFIVFFVGKILLSIHAVKQVGKSYSYISKMLANSVPSIIIGFLIIIWMPGFSLSSFIFLLTVLIIQVNSDIILSIEKVPVEYYDSLQSQIHNDKVVKHEIYSNGLKSNLLGSLIKNHKYIWTLLIFFEFANALHGGFGSLVKLSLDYWNTSYLLTVLSLVIIVVFLGDYLLRAIFNRLFPWGEVK